MSFTESRFRSIIKAVSWRIIATCITFLYAYLFTAQLPSAGFITIVATLLSMVLHYFFERGWNVFYWNKIRMSETKKRTLLKSILWQLIAVSINLTSAWLFTGSIGQSFSFALVSGATGFVVFYMHERLWNSFLWHKKMLTRSRK